MNLLTQILKNAQHRNSHLAYFPKEYALRELTHLYSFTGLKIVHDNSDNNQKEMLFF